MVWAGDFNITHGDDADIVAHGGAHLFQHGAGDGFGGDGNDHHGIEHLGHAIAGAQEPEVLERLLDVALVEG